MNEHAGNADIAAGGRGHAGRMERFDFGERPFLVFWEVTRACALACRHCRAEAQTRAHPEELGHDEALKLIDDLAELAPPLLVLTGGDPMMRRDLMELIRAADAKGMKVGLSPAATNRLVKADFHALKAAGVHRMSLSLDGATRETHDAFRGVEHTFDRTMEAIRKAGEAGIPLQINTTVTRQTLGEFDQFVELMKEVRPAMWSVFLLVPTGRAVMDQMPGAPEIEDLWWKLAEMSHEVDFDIKTTEGHHYRRVVMQEAKARGLRPSRPAIATRDGKGVMFISHTGEIQPSGFLPVTAGNVRKDNVAEVYRSSEVFRDLRDEAKLGGKCGVCPYNGICGGSRSRAYAAEGCMFAADPSCSFIPPGWEAAN